MILKRTTCLLTAIAVFALSYNLKAQNLSHTADSLRIANRIPEIAFAVIKADTILEMQAIGFHRADLSNESTKATLKDYFHLGSNTKAITGFIAGYLVENNKIKWTTPLFELFPEWKKDTDTAYRAVTLADLLSHRARIRPYTSGLEFKQLPIFKGTPADCRLQFAHHLIKESPVPQNAASFNYSNAGYSIAAAMLEKASGKTWEALVEEVLKAKLHLHYKLGWPNKDDENQPWGHWIENGQLKALPPDLAYNLNLAEPAGDISMTLPDYARFIQLNLQGTTGTSNLLKADTYNFLHFGLKQYAIGWGSTQTADRQFIEHTGSAGTFFCHTVIDKNKKIAYIVVANSATEKIQQAITQLLIKMSKKYGR